MTETTACADEAPQLLITPTADFDLEPLVGLSITGAESAKSMWLSWDETQQLARFLREHVAA